MAGDWIKMQTHLWDHPKVVRIVSAICPQGVRDLSLKCRVIGALFRTWSLADAHSDDGVLDGYDYEALDAAVGIEGWAENLQHVGWLIIEAQRLIVPRFEEHNSSSSKRRAEDAKRKKTVRKTSAKCPQGSGQNADQRREEKRREDIDSANAESRRARVFVPPTLEEVAAYCQSRSNGIDPQAFLDHYEANGWKVGGKSKMVNWQASVRTWEKRNKEQQAAKAKTSTPIPSGIPSVPRDLPKRAI